MSLSKNINSSLELVQPRKTRPFITERLLMERKESEQTKQNQSMISTTSERLKAKLLYKLLGAVEISCSVELSMKKV